jgi:hypothetical protein
VPANPQLSIHYPDFDEITIEEYVRAAIREETLDS